MKKSLTLKIVLSAIMAALAIVLEKFSIPLGDGTYKITLYGLPLLFSGLMFGPAVGALSGIVVGFIAQLTSQYGLSITSPLWMIAPILWGGLSGIISKFFRKKENNFSVKNIILSVAVTSFMVSLVNSNVMYLDGMILGYVVEQTAVNIIIRFAISLALCVPYSLVLYFTCNRLNHLAWNNKPLKEENE